MMKKKIAILGGGMAGLSAAYELTKTQELREQHDVTVYQMGWRLGGKAASGRDAKGRSLEHGLHVWFGCYENVFRMTQQVYEVWRRPNGCPLQHWTDVAKPQVYTPLGVLHRGEWTYVPLEWPIRGGIPGDGSELVWTPWEAMRSLSSLLIGVVRNAALDYAKMRANNYAPDVGPLAASGAPALPFSFAAIAAQSSPLEDDERSRAESLWHGSQTGTLSFEHFAEAAHLWTKHLLAQDNPIDADAVEQIAELYDKAYAHLESVANATPKIDGATISPINVKLRLIGELVNIFGAVTRGYFLDLLLPDRPFEALDAMDLRDWLKHHGAHPDIVDNSTVVRIVYDTLFQFKDGDVARPSYAAGTALGVTARLLVTYKNAMMWDIQAGMGEAVVAPLYEVLRDRGVAFRFFHKVTKLELSADKKSIERIRLKRQAKVRTGEYEPLKTVGGLRCWAHEPDWTQLETDPRWKPDKLPDFESHWLDGPAVGDEIMLQRGDSSATGFDVTVLAISMGAYKPLNNSDTGMCDELIARGGAFADFVRNIDIVPTQALQLWCNKSLDELGWTSGKPAAVSGPEYLNIWADMSQVLAFEGHASPAPCSLHYLCGTLATDSYRQPSTNRTVPETVRAQVKEQQMAWLNEYGGVNWPNAWSPRGGFDFSVLVGAPAGSSAADLFEAQHYRANVSPTECCVLSSAGTTQYRLHPYETGFENIVLAGEATRHGFNTTAIEGAVMSGMAASWAICRSPQRIPGYDFLQRKPSDEERDLGAAGTATSEAALPPYIRSIGHGAVSLAAPARFTGAKAHAFIVDASMSAMQRLVAAMLTPAAGGVRYTVSAPLAVISFLDIEQCTSVVDSFGWVPGRECAIWIPVVERRPGRCLPRPVLWSPYIFINYTIGMATGREVWGWPKAHADITLPRDSAGGPSRFVCSTTVFKKLATTTRGELAPLFMVSSEVPLRQASGPFARAGDALRGFTDVLSRAAAPAISCMGLPLISAVALKQFRHSLFSERACYQAVVDSPLRVTRFRGSGMLAGDYKLNITTCESHQIAQDIFDIRPSANGTIVPVRHAMWAEFDFDALPGEVIVSGAEAKS